MVSFYNFAENQRFVYIFANHNKVSKFLAEITWNWRVVDLVSDFDHLVPKWRDLWSCSADWNGLLVDPRGLQELVSWHDDVALKLKKNKNINEKVRQMKKILSVRQFCSWKMSSNQSYNICFANRLYNVTSKAMQNEWIKNELIIFVKVTFLLSSLF